MAYSRLVVLSDCESSDRYTRGVRLCRESDLRARVRERW